MSDERDYLGELWSVIREQERVQQVIHLLEGLRSLPTDDRAGYLDVIRDVRRLAGTLDSLFMQRVKEYEEYIRSNPHIRSNP